MKKMKYYFDNIVSRGTGALMALLVVVTLLVVLLLSTIAYLYVLFNPSLLESYAGADSIEGLNSLVSAFWFTFHHVIAPGEELEPIVSSPFIVFLIMTLATFWGIIVFSLIISFISSAFNDKLESLRRGRNLVVEKNHTLILDYNESVPILIEEFIEAFENRKKSVIVILSENDPVEVLRDIYAQTPRSKEIRIIVRMGNPTRVEDLEMVSAGSAKSIIIATQNDIKVIKQILALKKTDTYLKSNPSYIVAMVQDYHNLEVVQKIGDGKVEVIYLEELKSKVFARSCLHPGLSHVYKQIFSFVGNEIYLDIKDEFKGKTFKDLNERLEGGSLLGILHQGVPSLNPPADTIIQPNDKAIILSESYGSYVYSTQNHQDYNSSIISKPYENSPRKILGLGYNVNVPYVIEDMEKYVGTGSQLTLLVPDEEAKTKLESRFSSNPNFKLNVIIGPAHSYATLQMFKFEQFDTIAVFANDQTTIESADEQTLLTLLHLQEFKSSADNFPTIVVEIRENKSVESLEYVDVDDFIVSNILISKIMAQVSEDRYLYAVINELVSEYGQEFYLKRVSAYLTLGTSYPIYALVQSVLKKNEVFVGYKKKGEQIVLNPSKYDEVEFGPDDRVIVAATG
jgi:Trk K+ transport system NAD-binding subunit